jgi:hypothetical protein
VKSLTKALPHGQPITEPKSPLPDPRALQAADLYSLVRRVTNLSANEQSELCQVLLRYKDHLKTKPGRCNLFTYEFRVEADKPIIGFSRPSPFAFRPAARDLINQMLADDVLEVSTSPVLNHLTVVTKKEGDVRICVDARKVNEFTVPDHERTSPINELLLIFHGARYFTSLDLSSTYLRSVRRYTAFLFDSTVYQYKRVPYGFRNSLSAFVRAIKVALGGANLENVVTYVDILIQFAKIFRKLGIFNTLKLNLIALCGNYDRLCGLVVRVPNYRFRGRTPIDHLG